MFQLQEFNLSALAALKPEVAPGAFGAVSFNEYNRISHDGDGRLVIQLSGAEPRKVREQQVVLAGFEGSTFQQVRRVFYMNAWKPGQESTAPDCQSADGVAPDAAAPNPQSASCKTCAHGAKDATSRCSYKKDFLLYAVNPDPTTGMMALDTQTAFTWTASSLSLFPKLENETNSAGVFEMVKLLTKAGAMVEAVVLSLGFHQSGKAPVLKVAGMLPKEQTEQVVAAASQPEVRALLNFHQEKANKPSGAALPAPTRAPAIAMDSPRAAAAAAMAPAPRPAPRPAPPAEVVVPEAELYQAPAPTPAPVAPAPAVNVESDEDREMREMEEMLAAKRAARAAAANRPAEAKVVESTATVRTMPPAVSPPVSAPAAAPAPVAVTPPATLRAAALVGFGAARKA